MKALILRGAPPCAPSSQGGHMGPPLQKINYCMTAVWSQTKLPS